MATIVTRAGKGSPLTHTEVDANFTNLNDEAATKAPLASPALTGTPTAPTAAVGTNTTQIATTAFVNAEIADDAPTKTGGGASGTWGISISGNAATVSTITAAQVGTATAGLAVGAVGTYAYLWRDNTSISEGSTYAGSSLTYASMCDDSATSSASNVYRGSGLTRTSTTPAGTWMAMGAGSFGSNTYGQATLFLRIS